MSTLHDHARTWLGAIASRWRSRRRRHAALSQIDALGDGERARVARDAGLNVPEMKTLAGKWPDSANLLVQRLSALQLHEPTIASREPAALRDLQRVCTTCDDKQRCGEEIDRANGEWRTYCPNVETLDALDIERLARRLDH